MPEVIFNGPGGRIEGRYQPGKVYTNHEGEEQAAPLALILHPHPQFGGTMNNRLCYEMYHMFVRRNFSVLRFNFRGVGKSQGEYDQGQGELSDAATALDYLQSKNPNAPFVWVAGLSFGAWIGMQLLMRRPEIVGFVSASAAANIYDFSFLAPCPASGVVLHGDADRICPWEETRSMVEGTRTQKGRRIDFATVEGGDHFLENKLDGFLATAEDYLDFRLGMVPEGDFE